MFRHLITKERPRHVSSNLMPSKTNNNEPLMTSKSSPDGTQHSELHHGENTACGLLCITYVHLCKDTFGIVLHKVLTSDTQGCASQTPCQACSRVGTHFSTIFGPYAGN